MKNFLKKMFKFIGYKIGKESEILLLDENPFLAIKNKLVENEIVFDVGANLGQTIKKMNNNFLMQKFMLLSEAKNVLNF